MSEETFEKEDLKRETIPDLMSKNIEYLEENIDDIEEQKWRKNIESFLENIERLKERENRINKNKAFVACFTFVCQFIFCLVLPIVQIVFIIISDDIECDERDPLNLSLKNWLLGSAIVALCGVFINLAYHSKNSTIKECIQKCMYWILIFKFIYSIIGVVILYRSNIDCLENGEIIAVLTQITLILNIFEIFMFICSLINS